MTATQKGLIGLGATIALLLATLTAPAQMTTEQFIPMGLSPGLSGKYTVIGEITAADPGGRTIMLRGRSVAVTERTRIWLDGSKLQRPSVPGEFADLKQGRRVEVKFEDDDRRQSAAWIKVEAAE